MNMYYDAAVLFKGDSPLLSVLSTVCFILQTESFIIFDPSPHGVTSVFLNPGHISHVLFVIGSVLTAHCSVNSNECH